MNGSFEAAQTLEDQPVRMRFDDGHEVVATLISASRDAGGSTHLLYDEVTWSSEADSYGGAAGTFYYSAGEKLVSIERAGTSAGDAAGGTPGA